MKAKINLPVRGKKNRFNFQSTHETTMSFGCFLPAYVKDLVPNETISVDTRFFARLAPMLVPTFGDIRVNMKAFFVPFSYCWDYWNDFITAKPSARPNGTNSFVRFQHVPEFSWNALMNILTDEDYSSLIQNATEDSPYDFVDVTWNDQTDNYDYHYRKFTTRGKHTLQMLQSLGYNFSFQPVGGDLEVPQQIFNALPLIAYCAMFYDNFIPQQYKDIDRWLVFKQWLHEQVPDQNGRVLISEQQLLSLLRIFYLAYKQDYFTSLWQEPNAVRNTGNPQISTHYTDVVGSGGVRDSQYDSEPIVVNNTAGFVQSISADSDGVSPWQLRLAEKIQGWLTRNNLVGSDYVNRILANFGVKPVETLGVPKYCGQFVQQVKIDSVFDTAAVDAPLGTYAGRGIVPSQGVGKFEVSVKEHGMFFVVATLEPMVEFTDGIDRLCTYTDRFDFYTPDFDGTNMQAVGRGELFNTIYNSLSNAPIGDWNTTIGFAPRYSERKWAKSRVTGDFNVRHLAKEVAPYSLQRNLLDDKFSATPKLNNGQQQLTLSGITFQYDIAQFNRIFAQTDGSADPLFALFQFDVKLVSPMLLLGDSFEQFNSESNSIKMEQNGAYSN